MKRFILPLLLLLFVGSLFAVESAPSEVVGYVKYDCVAGLNLVALPMSQGYTLASEFADSYPGMLSEMNYWDSENQQWMTAVDWGYWEGDFSVEPGMVMMINALSPFTMYSIGDMPTQNASYNLQLNLNTLMIPLKKSAITLASELATDIGEGSLTEINTWDAQNQQWATAVDWGYWEGDFAVSIGTPLMVQSAVDEVVWPSGPRRSANSRTQK